MVVLVQQLVPVPNQFAKRKLLCKQTLWTDFLGIAFIKS
jgi:hypothetical protein